MIWYTSTGLREKVVRMETARDGELAFEFIWGLLVGHMAPGVLADLAIRQRYPIWGESITDSPLNQLLCTCNDGCGP